MTMNRGITISQKTRKIKNTNADQQSKLIFAMTSRFSERKISYISKLSKNTVFGFANLEMGV